MFSLSFVFRALLELSPRSYPTASPENCAIQCPGSPPPLMTSTCDNGPKESPKVLLSLPAASSQQVTSSGAVHGQLCTWPGIGGQSYMTVVPYSTATSVTAAPAAAVRSQHYPATFVAAVPSRSHQMVVACALPQGPWPTIAVGGPTYFPAQMSTATRPVIDMHAATRIGKCGSAKNPRGGRRSSSSETSDYHSFTSENDGASLLASPPATESGRSVKVERIRRPSSVNLPRSPPSTCSADSDVDTNEEIDVDGDVPLEDICTEKIIASVKNYICNVCCDAFCTMGDLQLHHREQHVQKRPYSCDLCDKCFQHPYSLRVHRRSQHNDVDACTMFPCDKCDREFASAASLRVHARMHTGERPFGCASCSKTFMRSHQLKMHQRVHTDTKPHVCKVCHKSFTQFKYLKEHCQRHARFLPYKCDVCEKAFLRPSHLKKHMRVHSAVGPVFPM